MNRAVALFGILALAACSDPEAGSQSPRFDAIEVSFGVEPRLQIDVGSNACLARWETDRGVSTRRLSDGICQEIWKTLGTDEAWESLGSVSPCGPSTRNDSIFLSVFRKLSRTTYGRGAELSACRATNQQPWATYLALVVRIKADVMRA